MQPRLWRAEGDAVLDGRLGDLDLVLDVVDQEADLLVQPILLEGGACTHDVCTEGVSQFPTKERRLRGFCTGKGSSMPKIYQTS